MFIVYIIYNKIKNKTYTGQTKEALAREKQLKSYQGRKFIKKIINSQYPNFALLAQPGRATAF